MSWKKVKLGEVMTHRKEFITISNSVEYKRCRVQVNRKGIVLRDLVKGIHINTKKQQVCKEGDFLVAEIDAKVGGYGFVPAELEDAIVSSHYFLFEVDETKMMKSYLAWIIKTDIIQEQISSKGSTNYAAIRPSHVLNFEIPLPPLIEQKKLDKKLNSFYRSYEMVLSEIAQQENYLTLLGQSILQEAVQGKLVPQNANDKPAEQLLQSVKVEKARLINEGKLKKEKELPPITKAEIPFELPKGWVWCRWNDLLSFEKFSIKRGPFGSDLKKEMFGEKGIRVFEQYNPINNDPYWARYFITEQQYKQLEAFTAKSGDLLISCSGATLGRITEIPDDADFGIINQALLKLNLNKSLISNSYFITLFRSSYIQEIILDKAGGSAIPNMVGISVLKQIYIPLPPPIEQNHIVSKIDLLQKQIKDLAKQIQESKDQSQQLLQSILRYTFAGEQEGYTENKIMTLAAEE